LLYYNNSPITALWLQLFWNVFCIVNKMQFHDIKTSVSYSVSIFFTPKVYNNDF
jgi:hypothetical protein